MEMMGLDEGGRKSAITTSSPVERIGPVTIKQDEKEGVRERFEPRGKSVFYSGRDANISLHFN